MNKEAREAKATEILVKVLQVLENEKLTIADAKHILDMAKYTLPTVATLESVPKNTQWGCFPLPDFANHPEEAARQATGESL